MAGDGGNGVWKWIAAILVTVILTGTPAIVQAIKAPSTEDIEEIRSDQQELLVRITKLEVQVMQIQESLTQHEEETRR